MSSQQTAQTKKVGVNYFTNFKSINLKIVMLPSYSTAAKSQFRIPKEKPRDSTSHGFL